MFVGEGGGGGTAGSPGAAAQEAAMGRKAPSSPATRWLAGGEEGEAAGRGCGEATGSPSFGA